MTIRISTLANGLRVATDTMPGAESVLAGAWVGAGTRDEPWGANGVAHLVEHMMFKGTKSRSAYALSTAIEKNGGNMNAHTTREETAYYARTLPEDTGLTLDIVSDMLQRSLFDEKELKREKQVVIQEIGRDIDTPEDHLYDLLHKAALPKQRLGRAILGSAKVIDKMPRAEIISYVKHHYNAQNMVVVGAGRVEHDEFVALAQKYFGKLPRGKTPKRDKAKISHGPCYTARDIEQLHLVLGFGGVGFHNKAVYPTQLLSILLGGNASSRLFQKIREKLGLVYAISASHIAFSDAGLFNIYAGTDPTRVGELIPVLCREILDVVKNVSKGELARAKAQIRADLLMGQESVVRRADNLGHQILNHSKPIPITHTLRKIEAVTIADVEKQAHLLFTKAPVVTALGPLGNLEPYAEIRRRLSA